MAGSVTFLVNEELLQRGREEILEIGCDDATPDRVAHIVQLLVGQQDVADEQVQWNANADDDRVLNELKSVKLK